MTPHAFYKWICPKRRKRLDILTLERCFVASTNVHINKQGKYILQLACIWPCHLIQRLNEGIADIFIGYCPVRTRAKTCLWDSTNSLHKVEHNLQLEKVIYNYFLFLCSLCIVHFVFVLFMRITNALHPDRGTKRSCLKNENIFFTAQQGTKLYQVLKIKTTYDGVFAGIQIVAWESPYVGCLASAFLCPRSGHQATWDFSIERLGRHICTTNGCPLQQMGPKQPPQQAEKALRWEATLT